MSTLPPPEDVPSTSARQRRFPMSARLALLGMGLVSLGLGVWKWWARDNAALIDKPADPAVASPAAGTETPSMRPALGLPRSLEQAIVVPVSQLQVPGDREKRKQHPVPSGLLVRELARQALLMSARDELGLVTRDPGLREDVELTSNAEAFPIIVEPYLDGKQAFGVELSGYNRDGRRIRRLLPMFSLPQLNWLIPLARHIEPLTRTDLVEFLKTAGFAGKRQPPIERAALPAAISQQLEQMDLISQFSAVRALHAALRRDGESPECLGALARGYSNLGALTEFLWNGSNKVFKARALLYAERLVVARKRSVDSLRSRAYVYALVGFHQAALDDLAETGLAEGAPAWIAAIRAFCAYEPEGLAAAERLPGNAQLVPYLRLLLNQTSEDQNSLIESCTAMLAANSNCEHAADILAGVPSLGVMRAASARAPLQFARNLYPRLAAVADLPAGVKRAIDARIAATRQDDQDFAVNEIPARQTVLKALHDAGRPESDQIEPSWQVLEQLINDVGFVQVWRLLDFQMYKLGVSPDETRDEFAALVKQHPYRMFIESFTGNSSQRLAALGEMSPKVDSNQLEFTAWPLVGAVQQARAPGVSFEHINSLVGAIYDHFDELYRDLARQLVDSKDPALLGFLMQKLQLISPHSPMSIVATLKMSPTATFEQLADWERRYGDRPEVLDALADRHNAFERPDDALRCLERLAAMTPSCEAFTKIADHKLAQGDREGWQRSLEASLELPSLGLEKSVVQIKLANYFMRRGEWERARPLADSAAQTYSGEGLECAGRCYEGLQDWKTSEAYFRAESERYGTASQRWFWWCCRTGRGNVAMAKRVAQRGLNLSQGPTGLDEKRGLLGIFLALGGQPAEALAAFDAAWQDSDTRWKGQERIHWAYYAILLAMELGDTARRDAALDFLQSRFFYDEARAHQEWPRQLESMFREVLGHDRPVKWDARRFDDLLMSSTGGEITEAWWFAGRFLDLLGEKELSRNYLELAATSPARSNICCTFANQVLRNEGLQVGAIRPTELEGARQRLAQRISRGADLLASGMNDKAIAEYTLALELDPECRPALWGRATALQRAGDHLRSLADFNQLVDASPDDLFSRKERALVLNRGADLKATIAEYEALLALDPKWKVGHQKLAWILATSPDESLRNGSAALEHLESESRTVDYCLTRAAAHAELEQFDQAVHWTERTIAEMRLLGSHPLLAEATRQRELYRNRRKYQSPPDSSSTD